mmetsp:Transcript_40149/g.115889  ORF Transcript_40149/g.115889 Transcript_40149/m.115889 type:complete len:267 (-) Transcript_40149:71-871(-)
MSAGTEESTVIRAHELEDKVFILPTWCDMCAGILVGRAYQCTGCKQRCHLGLGDNGAENCHADLLLQSCKHGVKHAKGTYQFGDITKQLARDAHQTVKDVVVKEAVKEQRGYGKFDKLKEQVHELKAQWSDSKALQYTLLLQSASVILIGLVSYIFPFVGLGKLGSGAVSLGRLLASWSVALLLFHHVLILAALRLAAAGMLRYSALVHAFVNNILHIDLAELEINLDHTAVAVQRVVDRAIVITLAVWVVSVDVWLKAVWAAAGD